MGIDSRIKHVVNLTDNPYDLRKCNLIVMNCGDNQKSDVRSKIEELKKKCHLYQNSKQRISNINATAVSIAQR